MNAERFPAVVEAAAAGRILADNAAGAQLPDLAVERMERYLRAENAQKGSIFARTIATTELVDEAKGEFAALIGQPTRNVGVGSNATTLALAFSRLLASTIRRGDRVVVTAADHEANVAPWAWLRRFGAQIDVVPVDDRGDLDEAKFRAFVDRSPVVVALPWASNATGTVYDVARLARIAKDARATVVVDAVQALPHVPIEFDDAIDFLFCSAYKAYAPHVAFWYASPYAFERFISVDSGDVPGGDARYWTLESGTQSYEALAGWLGTIAYFRECAATTRDAIESFAASEWELTKYALSRFGDRAPALRLYGRPQNAARLPVFAFNVEGMASDELAAAFERENVEARVGDYYAPRLLRALAPETDGRAVRLSLAHYTTTDDIDRCFAVLDGVLDRSPASSAT